MIVNQINRELLKLLLNTRPAGGTYKGYLADIFEKYQQMLRFHQPEWKHYCVEALESSDAVIDNVQESCSKLLAIYDSYMQGKIEKAVHDMDYEFMSSESIFADRRAPKEPLYRARTIESSQGSYDVREMFHVPFEQRGKISNNRFSIAGFPCLYFGKSILACWEEMQKPNIDNLCVSRVVKEERDHLYVIDLSWKEDVDGTISDDEMEQCEQYYDIVTWIKRLPLIIACSIRAFDPSAPFKEEYVIPQIMLSACIENEDIEGIAYTSTRRDEQIASDMELHKNYVFPVRKVTDKGYCKELVEEFSLTRGISFMEAEIKNVFHARGMQVTAIEDDALCFNDLDKGKSEYECTKFGQMEEYLGEQQFYTIHESMGVYEVHPVK